MLAGVSPLETPLLRQIKKFGYAITAIIRHHQRAPLRLWAAGPEHALRRAVPGGHRHRRLADPGRPAGSDHDHARHRRAAHGEPQRDRAAPAGGRDAGLGVANLLRQDRHADADGDDGRLCGDRGRNAQSHRRGLRQRGRSAQGRRSGRQGPGSRAPGARVGALQRRRAASARRAYGRSRAIRPRARFIRSPPSSGSTGRRSRPLIPASTSSRSNPSTSSWRRCNGAREGGQILLVKGAPEVILDHCDRQQDAAGKRPPLDRDRFASDVRRARRARRAGAGAGLAARSGPQSREPGSGRSAEDPRAARAGRASSIRRARKRSRR